MRALDGLRLLAALMVAAYHYGGRGGAVTEAWGSSPAVQFPTAHAWFAYGPLGVQIFFVISGFVICMSGWGRSLSSFFASRVARLMPAYWAAIVLVTLVFALPMVAYEAVSPATHWSTSRCSSSRWGGPGTGVCWTLWAEIRFYALFALCVVLPGADRRRIVLFCTVWTLAAALTQASSEPFLKVLLMPEYAPSSSAASASIWSTATAGTRWPGHRRGELADGPALRGGGTLAPAEPDAFANRSSTVIILIVTAGFAAVAVIALGALRRFDWPWLTVAGALTYPFYLVHEHLGWVVVGRCTGPSASPPH
ncbi:acyltransferase [Streptomyces sp. M10(2022)]